MQMPRKIHLPAINQDVVLVDREMMRVGAKARRMHCLADAHPQTPLPQAPATWDVSKGGSINYPVLGNDRYGDCYYVAVVKAAYTAAQHAGVDWTPDVNQLVQRYLQVAGGDVGMYDEQVVKEWEEGLIGPGGPRKLVNRLLISPGDAEGHSLAGYLFGGNIWTASLADQWLQHVQAGAVWDDGRNVRPNPGNGHAMIQTGKDASGRWVTQTWGLKPPVYVTQAGLLKCDPEIWVYWQEDWTKGGKSPNGHSRQQLREWWTALGGEDPGQGDDPGPGPGPGPAPGPDNLSGTLHFPGVTIPVPGFDVRFEAASLAKQLRRAGWSVQDVLAILELISQILQQWQGNGKVPQLQEGEESQQK